MQVNPNKERTVVDMVRDYADSLPDARREVFLEEFEAQTQRISDIDARVNDLLDTTLGISFQELMHYDAFREVYTEARDAWQRGYFEDIAEALEDVLGREGVKCALAIEASKR